MKKAVKKKIILQRPETIVCNPDLPVTGKKEEIIQAVKNNRVVIISGETGSGKTTQIPKICLEAGRGIKGKIACTQPRRIAAINVARRIAQELGEDLGRSVGYKIRFDDKSAGNACIKIMTDGILLAETQTDRFLKAYDTIIVDEAHERSLNIDFTLGILRQLVRKRNDLKLIITSATIDTQKFSQAFDGAPVIEVSGRMFPVETRYAPFYDKNDENSDPEDQGYVEAAAETALSLLSETRSGDILIFMPTEQDIGDTLEILRGQNHPGVLTLPLFARLSASEQSKIFSGYAGRKIIVSTNVAETSLTIPGIKYVIDTGLARIPEYSPRTRTTALPVSPVSRSSADQRKGRCGRVENGICIRLYDEEDYNSRPLFTLPEILRSNLAEVILRMMSLGLGSVKKFPFIDAPSPKSIKDGFDTLTEIGAITRNKRKYQLTETGRLMARLPVDPKLSRILIEADRQGCLQEALIIATALAISDPRQRPAEKAQAADQKHAVFKDPSSDFITLLNIWNAFKEAEKKLKSRSKLRQFCQENFISFKRVKEWSEVHRQIGNILKEHHIIGGRTVPGTEPATKGTKNLKAKEFKIGGPLYAAIHKSILAGYLANIAHKKEKNIFNAAKGQQAMIFPGSGLFNNAGSWIAAAEFVKTTQLFARTAAVIDPEWIEQMGKDLCSRTWFDAHWEKKRGEVTATEQVSLFGLIIASGRTVAYGKINPEEAGRIFIRHALVQGETDHRFEFMEHNLGLAKSLEDIENRQRRRDILASEDDMYLFYSSKLPEPFYNIRTFSKFIKDQKNQDFLKMSIDDLQKSEIDESAALLFPDSIETDQGRFRLEYEFKPGSEKDGITIHIPADSASSVQRSRIDMLVPGLLAEKITALIKSLPKSYRKKLVPVSEKARILARYVEKHSKINEQPLFAMLSSAVRAEFNFTIPPSQWSDSDIDDHLKMRISIKDRNGREIKALRSSSILDQFPEAGYRKKDPDIEPARKKYERENLIRWDFDDIKDHISINKNDLTLKYYPGLKIDYQEEEQAGLALRLFKSQQQALESHKKGVCRLYQLSYPEQFKALKKDISSSPELKPAAGICKDRIQFRRSLFDLITSTLFEKNVRTRQAFEQLAEKELKNLYHSGQEFIKIVSHTMGKYKECSDLIQKLCFKHEGRQKTCALISGLERELKNLVPENFMDLYTYERIKQLGRYMECMKIRAQRAADDPSKEEKKAGQVLKYSNHLNNLLAALNPETTREKSERTEQFFWLLEEYKISVFSPEIKTSVKISGKKLDKFLMELSTMM